jgi:type II secretory pathway component GspD/PulD (secretin)
MAQEPPRADPAPAAVPETTSIAADATPPPETRRLDPGDLAGQLTGGAEPSAAPDLAALRARFGPRVQVLPDGRIRRFLHVPHQAGAPLRALVAERWLPELFAAGNPAGNELAVEEGADVTLTTAVNPAVPTAKGGAPAFTTNQVWNRVPLADWLVVTADESTQAEVDRWLGAWWTGRDHIEVRVTVLEREISEADDFGSITEILPNSANAAFQGLVSAFPNTISGGGVFRLQDADDLNSTLQWIARRGKASIESVPVIVLRDHGSARISALTRTPYLQADRLDATGQASTFKLAFADTGVRMNVAASVVGLDRIFLELEIAVTSLNTALTNPNIPAPALSETSLPVPRVTIADGQSLWIGGLNSEFERELERKFPLLGDLPLVGYLFKSMLREKRRTEVIFVVTPTIKHYEGALPELDQTADVPLRGLFDRLSEEGER